MDWKPGDPERRSFGREAEYAHSTIVREAAEAAKVITDAAAVALKTVSEAANVAQQLVKLDIDYIKKDLTTIKGMLQKDYITKDQFWPVKAIVYGMVTIILTGCGGALLTLILVKHPGVLTGG